MKREREKERKRDEEISGKYHKYENTRIKERKQDETIDPLLRYFTVRNGPAWRTNAQHKSHIACKAYLNGGLLSARVTMR